MAPPISGVPRVNRNRSGLVIESPRAIAKPPRIRNPHSPLSKPFVDPEPFSPETVIHGRKTPTTTRMPPTRTNQPALRFVVIGAGRLGPPGAPADIPGSGGSGSGSPGEGGGVGG